jgi:3-oxoacyl-[acyl-carrier protein] reductase
MNLRFDGKNVLVTGGTRGIGRSIVERFADAGARVAFTFRASTVEAEGLKKDLEDAGTEVLLFQADAADTDAADRVVGEVIKTWGSLDVLVNNAGITRDGLLLRLDEEDWDAVVDTNLKSVFSFSKAAYRPMMRQRSGKIINMSSIVGVIGNAGQTNYAASKAGIIGFSKSLAKELGSRGVCVNVVAPGFVATDMTAKLSDTAREALMGAVPLGRPAQSSDISSAVLFLTSSAADYITGQVLHVDGGMVM